MGAKYLGEIPSMFRKSLMPTTTFTSLLQHSSPIAGRAKRCSILRTNSWVPYKITSGPFLCRSLTSKVLSKVSFNQRQGTSLTVNSSKCFSSDASIAASVEKTEVTKVKKIKKNTPEGQLRFGLDMCSKRGDVVEALSLYDKAIVEGIQPNQHHYNVLLYLCSSAAMGVLRPAKTGTKMDLSDKTPDPNGVVEEDDSVVKISDEVKELALKRGFEIYEQMRLYKITPNEATFTAAARLAVAKEDGILAFELVKKMADANIPPKLRSYGPALFTFCKNKEAERAYEVDAHMILTGVQAEEPELLALLKLSVDVFREERVYSLLHRLRTTIRQVSKSTSDIIEQWFKNEATGKVGKAAWDREKVREAVIAGGGGWHGQGWLGQGNWKVEHTTMDAKGVCRCCREELATIDIDPLETESFAKSLAALACEKELKSRFTSFQEWLDDHGPFEAVVDGANVGLYQQVNAFSFTQLNAVANGIRQISPTKKMPLIILHNKRTRGGPAEKPSNKQLIESWKRAGILYTTPTGSNDDWYWLYAAVRFKCLLVTDDEMRDHLFELLGNSFFPKWKERHQVRFTLNKRIPQFHMPPPYSIVIQESERGSWHIPIMGGDDIETSRKWLCVTRPGQFELERHTSSLSQNLEKTGGAVHGKNLAMKNSNGIHLHSDSRKAAAVGSEPGEIRRRSTSSLSPSSQSSHSKKTWEGKKLSAWPSTPAASPTRLNNPAAEMHTDCPVESKFDKGRN
eukprot:Gb_34667 [translate_table: standard]